MRKLSLVIIFVFLTILGCNNQGSSSFNFQVTAIKAKRMFLKTSSNVKKVKEEYLKKSQNIVDLGNIKINIDKKIIEEELYSLQVTIMALIIYSEPYNISYRNKYKACFQYNCKDYYISHRLIVNHQIALIRSTDNDGKYLTFIYLSDLRLFAPGEKLEVKYKKLNQGFINLKALIPDKNWVENRKIIADGIIVKIN